MNKLSDLICNLIGAAAMPTSANNIESACNALDEWEKLHSAGVVLYANKPERNKLQEAIEYAETQSTKQCGRLDGYGNAKREAYFDMITRLKSLDKDNG